METFGYQLGKKYTVSKTFSESDVYLFAGIILDQTQAHINEEYCRARHYRTRLVHGLLTLGLCSTVTSIPRHSRRRFRQRMLPPSP